MVNKFWPEGLLIVHAGGKAGLFSAICAGWTGGRFRHEVEGRDAGDPAMKPGLMLRDPTAETASDAARARSPLDTASQDKTIALMDIGKMRGDEFIDRLEKLCRARGMTTRRFKKPTNTRVAPREMIGEIADKL